MSKSVSGIKTGNSHSVRDIKPDHRQKDGGGRKEGGNEPSSNKKPPRRSRNQQAATYGMWFIGIVVLLLLFFLFSVIFAETTVTITPRTAPISIDNEFTAVPTGNSTSSADTLSYTVTSVQETRSQIVDASGTEYRKQKAQGEMRIINEHSQNGIQLVANTRFRSPSGNIYRTQSAVTVPGMDGDQPGEVIVPVVADTAGSDYNVDSDTKFTVPGFSGTPQEGEVYGRANTPINGGIDKEVPRVATSTRTNIANSLRDSLQQKLESDLTSQLAENEITYEDGIFFQTNTTADTTESGQAEVGVTGSLQALTFDRRALSIYLANQTGVEADSDTNLQIQDLSSFTFSLENDDFQPDSRSPVDFTMSGNSLIVWKYNKQALTRDLQGLQKNQVTNVLDNYPSIQSAKINTRPFWKRSLPTDRGNIRIETSLPTENNS